MKSIILLSFLLTTFQSIASAQARWNDEWTDRRADIPAHIDSFARGFDMMIGFTEQNSPRNHFNLLVKKNNIWSYWTYSDYFYQWTKKDTIFVSDTIRLGTFWKGRRRISKKSIQSLLLYLNGKDFWGLRNDSLNYLPIRNSIRDTSEYRPDSGPSDQSNFRFAVFKKNKVRIVESYGVDYFVEKYPGMLYRKRFLDCRNKFLEFWQTYCR